MSPLNPLFDKLQKSRLLVSSSKEDDLEFESVKNSLMGKLSEPKILYLLLAQGCNFNCSYCPVPGLAKKYGEDLLSSTDADAGLELWSRHLADDEQGESYVIFYGGEPLLNKPTFYSSLSSISKLRSEKRLPVKGLNLMLATNGTLIDEGIVEACIANDVLISVGLDGPRQANDRFRVYSNGHGTYDDILSMLRHLQDRGVRLAISATITPYTVVEFKEFSEILRSMGLMNVGFNFLKGETLVRIAPWIDRTEFVRQSVQAVLDWNRTLQRQGREYQVGKKVMAFRSQDFFPVDCTCYGNQLVVRPNGLLSNCPFSGGDLGHVQSVNADFRIAKTEVVQQWRCRLPLLHSAFDDLDAMALCGPGCAWGAMDSGNLMAVDQELTAFSQEIFDDLIWSGLEHGE